MLNYKTNMIEGKNQKDGLNRFTGRVVFFAFTIIVFIIVLYFFARVKLRECISIDEEVTVLVCGDSHTQVSIDDSLLQSSLNISHSAQAYCYTYSVLRLLLQENAHIDTIILGYSFHSLSANFLHKDQYLLQSNYLMIVDISHQYDIIKSNGIDMLALIVNRSYQYIIKRHNHDHIQTRPFIGKYCAIVEQNLTHEEMNAAIARHFHYTNNNFGNVQEIEQLEYLLKIDKLCKEYSVSLFLINCPVRDEYYQAIPKQNLDKYYSTASLLNATLLDYHNYPMPDSCFADNHHLNITGASVFTLLLDSVFTEHNDSSHQF